MGGLIPNSFIEELLGRVDIVEIVERRVPLKKAGKEFQACCPFHEERTPSFKVDPRRDRYRFLWPILRRTLDLAVEVGRAQRRRALIDRATLADYCGRVHRGSNVLIDDKDVPHWTNNGEVTLDTDDLARITGQKPSIRRATKSISNFKLREGMPVGTAVTIVAEREGLVPAGGKKVRGGCNGSHRDSLLRKRPICSGICSITSEAR